MLVCSSWLSRDFLHRRGFRLTATTATHPDGRRVDAPPVCTCDEDRCPPHPTPAVLADAA